MTATAFEQGSIGASELDALKIWRNDMVGRAQLPVGALKDVDLQKIVTRGRRDHRIINTLLPSTYRRHTPAIVQILMSVRPPSDIAKSDVHPPAAAHASPPAVPPAAPPAAGSVSLTATAATAIVAPPARQPPEELTAEAASAEPVVARRSAEDLARYGAMFAALDYSEPIGDPQVLGAVPNQNGTVLTWPVAPGSTTDFYRVVATDGEAGFDPAFSRLVDVTENSTAIDAAEYTHAVRYYQVWRNSGRTAQEALGSQPRLHAQSNMIARVEHVNILEDGGRVVAQWSSLPGVERVHVFRIPVERAAQTTFGELRDQISQEESNLTGFIDRHAVRGQRYLYRFMTEAKVDGVSRLSAPTGRVVKVSAVLTAVEDLCATSHGTSEDWLFDLAWSEPPAGRVVMYRSQAGPAPGSENAVHGQDVLPAMGLAPDCLLAHPVGRDAEGGLTMRDVPSPHGWSRVYFTPVTLLDDQALVGRTVSKPVIPEASNPVIVERTEYQLLKFGWPGEAAKVGVQIGAAGVPSMLPQSGDTQYEEISREQYRQLGSLHFRVRLPELGCSVHLAGISFVGAERFAGTPVTVQYPGLIRLSYMLDQHKTFLGKVDRVRVDVHSVLERSDCPSLVLIYNRDRLPLHRSDGDVIRVTADVDHATQPVSEFRPETVGPKTGGDGAWKARIRGLNGYLRLFVNEPPEKLMLFALIDPPVSTMTIGS